TATRWTWERVRGCASRLPARRRRCDETERGGPRLEIDPRLPPPGRRARERGRGGGHDRPPPLRRVDDRGGWGGGARRAEAGRGDGGRGGAGLPAPPGSRGALP